MAPLRDYVRRLRQRGLGEIPDFDPFDGGIHARILFLLEKPGPMTSLDGQRAGSGFISRNNDDATAEATYNFLLQAGIPRTLSILWNLIPAWNGVRKVTPLERANGLHAIDELCGLLPNLNVVVLVGRTASRAKAYFEAKRLPREMGRHPPTMGAGACLRQR